MEIVRKYIESQKISYLKTLKEAAAIISSCKIIILAMRS